MTNRILAGAFFAVIGTGLFLGNWIEAIQIWRNGTTLSQITGGLIGGSPHRAAIATFVAGVVVALLLVHFTNVWRIWKP